MLAVLNELHSSLRGTNSNYHQQKRSNQTLQWYTSVIKRCY